MYITVTMVDFLLSCFWRPVSFSLFCVIVFKIKQTNVWKHLTSEKRGLCAGQEDNQGKTRLCRDEVCNAEWWQRTCPLIFAFVAIIRNKIFQPGMIDGTSVKGKRNLRLRKKLQQHAHIPWETKRTVSTARIWVRQNQLWILTLTDVISVTMSKMLNSAHLCYGCNVIYLTDLNFIMDVKCFQSQVHKD